MPTPASKRDTYTTANALIIVDGKTASKAEANAIDPAAIQSVRVLKGEQAVKVYGEKGRNGVIEINKKTGDFSKMEIVKNVPDATKNPLYIVDGKEVLVTDVKQMNANNIESIDVLKGENAIKKYGERGKNGVVEITTKPPGHTTKDSIPDKVFTKVENEPEFPGGREAWLKYIVSQVEKNRDKFTREDFGTCLVKFIVNTDGSVSNVEDSTMKDTQLGKVAVEAIRSGPKWIPATQNDHVVAAYKLQPVSLTEPKLQP